MRAIPALETRSNRGRARQLIGSKAVVVFITFCAELRVRIEFQAIGFNGFVTGATKAVADAGCAAKGSFDLPHLFMIPARQTIEESKPILICAVVHPLCVLFDLVSFTLQML